MKASCLFLCFSVFSGALAAEQTDSCAGLEGTGLTQCRSNQQTLRLQERLEQQLQQQQERQNELDKQQREVQQQLENMRLENQNLRKQLEREMAEQPARPVVTVATDASKSSNIKSADIKSADIKSWKADHPWFGTDYARTQFAMRYVDQLQQQRPDLTGRELLDALSTKVDETFGAKH